MLTDTDIRGILEETDAIRRGHFQLTSGRHSDTYVQCARVCEYPAVVSKLATEAVRRLPAEVAPDLVIAPAVGGLVFGFAVAQALDVRFIFTEREGGAMTLRRAFEVAPGTRALVVEDVVTTGGSVAEVCAVVEACGGEVCGVVALIDRGGERAFDAPFYPLLTLEAASWEPDECRFCADAMPLTSPGSRRL
ncbi:MAG: orotate phosphoribosyltransferase [Coriobacteriia bacterium]|nr:orotate phosphoribosyltransferase [Coriobacteriia bacterium]